jgi:hypothetical protein
MMDAESQTIAFLNSQDGPPAFGDVPEDRPDVFITVERTSGPRDFLMDKAVLAVQVWGQSRAEVAGLAVSTADTLDSMALLPDVAQVQVTTLYHFPAEQQERYQLLVNLTMMTSG